MNNNMIVLTLGQLIVIAINITGAVGQSKNQKNNEVGFATPLIELAKILDKPDISLSQLMWDDTYEYAKKALNTSFVQGLRFGSANPTDFGVYNAQDAVYLEKQADALKITAENATDQYGPNFKEFLLKKVADYTRYANEMYKDWQLTNSSCVQLDNAVSEYTNYKLTIARTKIPPYSIVAMIPCLKLWPWIGEQFKKESHNSGVYEEWVTYNFNASYTGYEQYEDMVDDWYDQGLIDQDTATNVYRECMNGEYSFFWSATNRNMTPPTATKFARV